MWVDPTGAMHPAVADAHAFANPRVSPDGRRIAVTISAETDDIWIYDLATGTPTKLTSGGNNSNPEWNKDGSQIFSISDRSGKDALWHQGARLGGNAELVHGTEGVFAALLSPDNITVLTITPEFGGTLHTPAISRGRHIAAPNRPGPRAAFLSRRALARVCLPRIRCRRGHSAVGIRVGAPASRSPPAVAASRSGRGMATMSTTSIAGG